MRNHVLFMLSRSLLLLVWVIFIHLTGIYLFTGGFLLTRLALSESTFCADKSCSFPPTHNRAVVLIVDALRFDFLSANPPQPVSPFYHNVLTLPRHLTEKQPKRSFLFNSYADPPTTTMQRLKGITTGSLPTFIDLGNNFGASSIAEDSIINQLGLAGKRVSRNSISRLVTDILSLHSWAMIHGCLYFRNPSYLI